MFAISRTYFFTRNGVVSAVDDVSFSVGAGETLGIVGESGCGKSVTSLSIMRLIPSPPGKIVGGEIILRVGDTERDLVKLDDGELRKIRGNDIAMIFQDPMTSLNPVYTVGNQLCEPLMLHLGLNKNEAEVAGDRLAATSWNPSSPKIEFMPIPTSSPVGCVSAS